jgi:transposase-like protein
MDCPRCEAELERYALFGREAFTCEECGYLGVPVDHEPTPQSVESWSDALERFREEN